MSNVVIGVGDCKVSNNAADCLVTYALGSCIAIVIHDPTAQVAGMLHYLLPDSTLDPDKAARSPYMFADTGIPALFHLAYALGAKKNRLRVTVVGGAQVLASEFFNVGKRNQLAMKKILWRAGVLIHHEETGGEQSRTIRIETASGKCCIKVGGGPERELGTKPPPHPPERSTTCVTY
jgi:chemotaxis protein CheD